MRIETLVCISYRHVTSEQKTGTEYLCVVIDNKLVNAMSCILIAPKQWYTVSTYQKLCPQRELNKHDNKSKTTPQTS